MKWVINNYKGEKQVWYSGDVIEKIKQICDIGCKNKYCGSCNCEIDCLESSINKIKNLIESED